MRKVLLRVAAPIVVVAAAAVLADFSAATYAEYQLSRTLRGEAHLESDPAVAIVSFPFITQAADHSYHEVEIKVPGVTHAPVGQATLEATLHDVDLSDSSWVIRPSSSISVGEVESRIIIDSTHIGQYLKMKDLVVGPPAAQLNDATGGTTESGISASTGLIFTGTPDVPGITEPVSVLVNVSMDNDVAHIIATDIARGPNTVDRAVTSEQRPAVLAAFSTTISGQRLPFNVASTRIGARFSDLVIEGIARDRTISLNQFAPS